MNEAVSNSMVMSLTVAIIGVCIVIVTTSIVYSKAFKIKNRIVEIIEKHGEYSEPIVKDEIDVLLKDSGYSNALNGDTCPKGRGTTAAGLDESESGVTAINTLDKYRYCIYKYKTVKGYYYSVVTYMNIEFPLIGDLIRVQIPVYGDTKVFADF